MDHYYEDKEEFLPRLTEDVRNNLQENYDMAVPNEYTGFIVRCLRVKDYDVEKASKLLKNFAKSTQQLEDMLDKFQPKFYRDLFLNGYISVLSSRDSLGRQILTSRVGKWDPKVYDFDDAACAAMLLFSYIVGQSAETQRKGVIFVHDLRGFGLQHVRAVKPGRLTQLVSLMQDGSPGRIKGVHFIFHPRLFSFIYQLVKPFLKEKLAKRIHFHGDDLGSLHKQLRPEILPKFLGGHKDDSQCYDLPMINKLLQEDSIHKQLRAHSIPYL